MPLDIDNSANLPDHALDVFTSLADLQAYVSLKHAITIMGFNVDVYLPQESTGTQANPLHDRGDGSLYSGEPYVGAYNPDDRTGSVYNEKEHAYRYPATPDFTARIKKLMSNRLLTNYESHFVSSRYRGHANMPKTKLAVSE